MSEFNKPSEPDFYNHIESMNRVKKAFDEEMQMRAKTQQQVYDELRNGVIEEVLQLIKELRPAIKPLEGMGKGKTTQEWFDILVKDIKEMKK